MPMPGSPVGPMPPGPQIHAGPRRPPGPPPHGAAPEAPNMIISETVEPVPDTFTHEKPRDPYWYKRAVFYEVLIRGFHDATGDGTGDMRGLINRLDYLQW